MSHWQQIDRCIRELYYDIEAQRVTTAGQIDDRMYACSHHLVAFQNDVRHARRQAYPIRIRALQEADVQPEPR